MPNSNKLTSSKYQNSNNQIHWTFHSLTFCASYCICCSSLLILLMSLVGVGVVLPMHSYFSLFVEPIFFSQFITSQNSATYLFSLLWSHVVKFIFFFTLTIFFFFFTLQHWLWSCFFAPLHYRRLCFVQICASLHFFIFSCLSILLCDHFFFQRVLSAWLGYVCLYWLGFPFECIYVVYVSF